ncbi:uncharacterized protein LACBIDRAFT_296633 [Laccaria bicolor S238N-H82]|nr:uncharacterized protein LACBIDRAFT_296633 [Laccaria bicolor S238N-H82]EDR08983.1 predicted protein [Laccaria bicolor S238N-H82]|eukprot:XP_001880296.1 predicted protein [Laccaria bicolor S238N-H82]
MIAMGLSITPKKPSLVFFMMDKDSLCPLQVSQLRLVWTMRRQCGWRIGG